MAVIEAPAQTLVLDTEIGVEIFAYCIVFPVIVIVQGEYAPIHVLLQPLPELYLR